MDSNQKLSTRQLLEKIPNFPCLYRHSRNEVYYGIKKVGGKRKEHSLDTTDRKVAERRLKSWLADLDNIDVEVEKMRLNELVEKFKSVNQGKSSKTRATNDSIINRFTQTWSRGMDVSVRDVKPSDLSEWLATHEGRLKNTTYNRYACFLKQLFALAVADRVIPRSPYDGVRTRWKKPQKPIRYIPTVDQFEAIVASIRSQQFSNDAENTANFVEFLGCAGLGQAEARQLTWGAIDWPRERLAIRRKKTAAVFYVPIYDFLRPLLLRLKAKTPNPSNDDKVFKIQDAKKALQSACRRLNYRQFTQRNIRASCIQRLWQAGVDVKLIARWQGHSDGGRLIMNTYTEVFGENDAGYEQAQLAKLKGPTVQRQEPSANPISV